MKKSIIRKILAFFICLSFASVCFASPSSSQINVGVLNGPSGLPCAYLMENVTKVNGAEVEYETFANAQMLLAKILKGELDIGFLPPNVAAKVYNTSNGAVKVCALTGNGMLSLITKDSSVKSLADLKGKTVSVAGQGATPEFMLRFLLEKNGIKTDCEEGVTLDFSIPNADIAAALITGKIEYAVVPEPFSTVATLKDSSVIRAINIQDEYKKVTGKDSFPMTVMVVNAAFAKDNAGLVRSFMSKYDAASKWTVKNASDAGSLVEKYSLGLTKAVCEKAIPNANYVYKTAWAGRSEIEVLLKIFLDFDVLSIGGKMPDGDFYFR